MKHSRQIEKNRMNKSAELGNLLLSDPLLSSLSSVSMSDHQGLLITTAMRGTDSTEFKDLGLTRRHVEAIVNFFGAA